MRSLDEVFARLPQSRFRASFRLAPKDRSYLRDKGLEVVLAHARDFIDRRLAPAEPANDGKQTPYRGHPVFTAQHATATCCRTCLMKWHGVEKGRAMTEAERTQAVAAIGRWLEAQA